MARGSLPSVGIRRRIAASALTGIVALGAGCTSTPSPTTTSAAPVPQWTVRGPLTWLAPKDRTGTLATQVAGWNQAHPNAPVQLEWLPDASAEWRSALLAAAARKDGRPTMMSVPVNLVPDLVAASALVPVPDSASTEGIIPRVSEAGVLPSGRYVMPLGLAVRAMFYRTDVLGAGAPTSWPELTSRCARIVVTTVSCFGASYGTGESLTAAVVEALRSSGTDVADASGKLVLDEGAASVGLAALAARVRSDAVAVEAKGWSEQDAKQAFAAGRVAAYEGWSTDWIELTRGTSAVAGSIAVAPAIPVADAYVPTLSVVGLSVVAGSVDQGSALDFAAWLNDPARQAERGVSEGLAPVSAGVLGAAPMTSLPAVVAVSAGVDRARTLPVVASYPKVTKALQDAGRAVIDGGDAATAAASLRKALSALIAG
jgi:multiple sugar transport system substrate-binding protein